MANDQGPGVVDQHIEKIILGVCLLVLLYAVIQFGLASPRSYEFVPGAQAVGPGAVDSALLDEARQVEQRVNAVQPDPVEERNDLAVLENLQDNPLEGMALASLDFGEPLRHGIGKGLMQSIETRDIPAISELKAAMPAPARPLIWAGPEMVYTPEPASGEGEDQKATMALREEEPTLRVLTWYPWSELKKAWYNQLLGTPIVPDLVAVRYEVEIQVRQPDGSWQDLEPDPQPAFVHPPTGKDVQLPEIPDYTGQNAEQVRQFIQWYDGGWQTDSWSRFMLQPPFYDILAPTREPGSWQFHLPELPEDYLAALRRLEERPEEPERPTGPDAPGAPGRDPSRRTPDRLDPDWFNEALRSPAAPSRGTPTPGGASAEPDQADGEPVPEPVELPEIAKQFEAGGPLMWCHVRGLSWGESYRSRFRVVFVNPLLASGNLPEERAEEAERKTLLTPWSPWSEPVDIERNVRFFVTGANPNNRELTVTMFTTYLGQWVSSKNSNTRVGQPIRSTETVKVLRPGAHSREIIEAKVDFETGAIALEFHFDREIETTTGRVSREGVELIYLTPEGKVASRFRKQDVDSDMYRKLQDEADAVKTEVSSAAPERRREDQRQRQPRRNQPERPVMPDERFDPGALPPGIEPPRRR